MVKKQQQPAWISEAVKPTVNELVEHLAARVQQLETEALAEGREGLQDGQLVPALILAAAEQLKPAVDRLGLDAVDSYTDAQAADGVHRGKAQGEELGPLMGLSRVGVFHAFGRPRKNQDRP